MATRPPYGESGETASFSSFTASAENASAFHSLRLPLDQLRVVGNIRRAGDDPELAMLAADIAVRGLLQPLVVRTTADAFDVIAGHRRLAAIQMLRWTHAPCLVVQTAETPSAYLAAQLSENLHRTNLAPLEEAIAFSELMEAERQATGRRCGPSGLAKLLCLRQPYVSERLSLLKLSAADRQRLSDGKLTLKAALKRVSSGGKRLAGPLPGDPPAAPVRKESYRDRGTGLRLEAFAEGDAKSMRADLLAAVRRWLETLERKSAKS